MVLITEYYHKKKKLFLKIGFSSEICYARAFFPLLLKSIRKNISFEFIFMKKDFIIYCQ